MTKQKRRKPSRHACPLCAVPRSGQYVGMPNGKVSGRPRLFDLSLGAFPGFFGAVGFALDGDDLGVVHQPVDHGDHAGGVGEDHQRSKVSIEVLERLMQVAAAAAVWPTIMG
jgi:hypothetical protein